VITRLVLPTEFGLDDGYVIPAKGNGDDVVPTCHIQDDPDGEAGASGRHDTNTDADHGTPAIVVQLMPYGTTPNPGGVYKAWMEKFDTYEAKSGQLDEVPVGLNGSAKKECPDFCAVRDPGFGPPNTDIKIDIFKVREKKKMPEPSEITIREFHDKDFDGAWDEGEEEVFGWIVEFTDPDHSPGSLYTPDTIIAALQGFYTFAEETPTGTQQTVSILDDGIASLFPTADPFVEVYVAADYSMKDQELHEVICDNVGLGEVMACKYCDPEGDGVVNEDLPLAGSKFKLSGTIANAGAFGPVYGFTGEDGCITFSGLLPGD
jgi:hypothetical protein